MMTTGSPSAKLGRTKARAALQMIADFRRCPDTGQTNRPAEIAPRDFGFDRAAHLAVADDGQGEMLAPVAQTVAGGDQQRQALLRRQARDADELG